MLGMAVGIAHYRSRRCNSAGTMVIGRTADGIRVGSGFGKAWSVVVPCSLFYCGIVVIGL
jgi:hypothetical protein